LEGPKAEGKDTKINMVLTDLGETWVLSLENAVLHAGRRDADASAAATVKLSREMLVRLVTAQVGLRELVFSDELTVEGSRLELLSFLTLLERPGPPFPIVTP
jgi:alkyl sulfatase BDS1-like metallo-beta-lactamase superfamily hydrolase